MAPTATRPLYTNGNNALIEKESTKRELVPTTSPKKDNISSFQPFDIVNSIITFKNQHHQFWWDRTGSQLAELLKYAGYEKSEQYTELLFYGLHVIPELGPSPDKDGYLRWRSPQTPDGTPIDLSWEWGLDGRGVIRTSFEPIGPNAGTEIDPFNRYETDAWIKHLDSQGLVASLDLEWYNHFMKHVLPDDLERVRMTDKLNFELAPNAGTFVTRDIGRSGPIVKLYIFPGLRAQELGISNLEVVIRAIKALPAQQYESLNPEPMLDYLREAAQKWKMETGIFSIDLISPKASRIKLYTRAPNTTVEYLIDALTLGGRYDINSYSESVLNDVKDFWRIFIGDAPAELPSGGEERAGPGFYFTIGAGKPATPKVYISPISFCENDAEVLARLRRYFETRTDSNRELMLSQMDNYEKALKSIYGTKLLEDRVGSHFYVSCALAKDSLRIVTYLCPQALTLDWGMDAIKTRKGLAVDY